MVGACKVTFPVFISVESSRYPLQSLYSTAVLLLVLDRLVYLVSQSIQLILLPCCSIRFASLLVLHLLLLTRTTTKNQSLDLTRACGTIPEDPSQVMVEHRYFLPSPWPLTVADLVKQADSVFSGISTFGRLPYWPCLADDSEKYDIAFLGTYLSPPLPSPSRKH